jgi:hypothetical protein
LRNEIYGYVLGGKYIPVDIDGPSQRVPSSRIYSLSSPSSDPYLAKYDVGWENRVLNNKPSHTFALLKVCRQVHTEARLLPFSLSTIKFTNSKAFATWCTAMGPLVVGAVGCVRLWTFECGYNGLFIGPLMGMFLSRAGEFTGLERVEVLIVMQQGARGGNFDERRAVLEKELRGKFGGALRCCFILRLCNK